MKQNDNEDLIKALKNAEVELAKAINTLTASIAKYERNPHPYIRIPGNPAAEANANALCCSCSYCTRGAINEVLDEREAAANAANDAYYKAAIERQMEVVNNRILLDTAFSKPPKNKWFK